MNRHEQALQILQQGTVIPAMPLALDAGRKLDKRRQRGLLRYYLDAGVGGIAAGVHTTQFAIRDPKYGLFEPVLSMVSEEISRFEQTNGKSILKVAGVTGETETALKEAELAQKLGYDAVLLSPGGLGSRSEAYLVDRARLVADIIPVIGFYLQPAAGGRILSYDFWRSLCEIPNVAAIKCAAFNRYQTLDVVRATALSSRSADIALYTGNDDNIVIDLLTDYVFTENGRTETKRFVGGLLGHWAVWTRTVVQLFERLKNAASQDTIPRNLLTFAAEVTDANAAFFDPPHNFAGSIAGVHEALRKLGLLDGIWCLDPQETLSPGQAEEIDRVFRMYPHLSDADFVRQNLGRWLA